MDIQFKYCSGTANYYLAEVLSQNDYYPFGMLMPGRRYSPSSGSGPYRYGFNGKENDNDVKGEGNSLDFGARIYDGRLGRWLSVDPMQIKNPMLSPHIFSKNSPIYFNDPDGKDAIARIVIDDKGNKTLIITANYHSNFAISDNVKKIVHKEFEKYGNREGITYKGEKIAVKFEINFVEHKVGEVGYKANYYKPFSGENDFVTGSYGNLRVGDLSNRAAVTGNEDLYTQKTNYKGVDVVIPKNVADEELANFIVHGIGHNIGFTHGENGEGVMDRTVGKLSAKEETSFSGEKNLVWSYQWDHISKDNVQNLVNNLDEMTEAAKSGKNYWDGKKITNKQEPIGKGKNKTYPEESVSSTGVTILK